MRNKIFGAIGVIWGALIVYHWFVTSTPESGSTAYHAGYVTGQTFAAIFGAVMLLVGMYYLVRKTN